MGKGRHRGAAGPGDLATQLIYAGTSDQRAIIVYRPAPKDG